MAIVAQVAAAIPVQVLAPTIARQAKADSDAIKELVSIHETYKLRFACLAGASIGGIVAMLFSDHTSTRKLLAQFLASAMGGYIITPAMFYYFEWQIHSDLLIAVSFVTAILFVAVATKIVNVVEKAEADTVAGFVRRLLNLESKNGNGK